MGTVGGPFNVWKITGDERGKHDEQFFALKPVNGFITGDQARGFFLQSGLPSAVLAQIWTLADMNKDGKMDRREFSVAMHLIQKKLQGFTIPASLPDSLKMDPDPVPIPIPVPPGVQQFGGFGSPPQQQQQQWMPQAQQFQQLQQQASSSPITIPHHQHPHPHQAAISGSPIGSSSSIGGGGGKIDWTMNQGNKLRYSQHFNAVDKARTGFLAGPHARNIFTQSGLPNPILAQIWTFADLDKDGRLTVEEFCIAMHLIDMVKLGATLPASLPVELLPPHLQHLQQIHRQRTLSFGSDEQAAPNELDESARMTAVSFEDKRRQNFERGQAELDRRRQLLLDQERREREVRERKEREEAERRERERMEQERRRQMELEILQAKQREEQQRLEEEHRKLMEQREAARRELERQREAELEKQRVKELTNRRQRDQELLCHAKQKQKTLSFQLQALNEKSSDLLNCRLSQVREAVVGLTASIESMKRDRDTKLVAIENGKRRAQELKTRSMQLANEKLKLVQSRQQQPGSILNNDFGGESVQQTRQIQLESLKSSLAEVEKEAGDRGSRVGDQERIWEDSREKAKNEGNEYRRLVEKFNDTVAKIRRSKGIDDSVVGVPSGQQVVDPFLENDNAWGAALDRVAENFGSAVGVGFGDDDDGLAWQGGTTTTNGHDQAATTTMAAVNTAKYKACYEFVGTNEDELSFQPGDVIIVFADHKGDEGWLAGQIGPKVGWFPEAFAEPMGQTQEASVVDHQNQNIDKSSSANIVDNRQSVINNGGNNRDFSSPPQQKLERIQEVPFEREDDARSSTKSSSTTTGAATTWKPPVNQNHEQLLVEYAQAQFAWKAKTDNHLSFNKGDRIRILEKQEMWWRGELVEPGGGNADGAAKGWFPKSYVKLSPDGDKQSLINGQRRKSENHRSMVPPPIKRKSESQEFPSQATGQSQSQGNQEQVEEWYEALYPFPASEPGDLGFEAGDRILVVSKQSQDWWTGKKESDQQSVEGVFPANYVQKVVNDDGQQEIEAAEVAAVSSATTATAKQAEGEERVTEAPQGELVGQAIAAYQGTDKNQLTLSVGDLVKIRAKSPTGWWEGELEKQGETKRVGWFPGNYVKVFAQQQEPGNAKNQQQQEEIVEALFDYAKQQGDEIAFSRGEKLKVTEKVDENWWKGESMDGKRVGLFPANYVKGE